MRLMRVFVLERAYLVDSEVDGSEQRTVARMTHGQMQHWSSFSPFWHFLLLLIPC